VAGTSTKETVMAQAQALQQVNPQEQPALRGFGMPVRALTARVAAAERKPEWKTLCAGCRAKEARYGFRPDGVEAAGTDRPRTLCFDCFRVEIDRRRRAAQQLAKGWNASQVGLPLDDTLNELSLRRRRAQIAARHALGLT
jgi:hypothetical protein